jgi:hypothetical protein
VILSLLNANAAAAPDSIKSTRYTTASTCTTDTIDCNIIAESVLLLLMLLMLRSLLPVLQPQLSCDITFQ